MDNNTQAKKAITQLETLKQEMKDKIVHIQEQSSVLEKQLKKIAGNKAVKINSKEKASFENECKNYIKALENLIQDIEQKIVAIKNFLTLNDTFSLLLHADLTKKFIKRIKKDIDVIHSRLSFKFEVQQKHLTSLEYLAKK